jgi:hypothetical protein
MFMNREGELPSGFLFDEPGNLLKQELRRPAAYNAVIGAIAGGASKLNEIATKSGTERDKYAKPGSPDIAWDCEERGSCGRKEFEQDNLQAGRPDVQVLTQVRLAQSERDRTGATWNWLHGSCKGFSL